MCVYRPRKGPCQKVISELGDTVGVQDFCNSIIIIIWAPSSEFVSSSIPS